MNTHMQPNPNRPTKQMAKPSFWRRNKKRLLLLVSIILLALGIYMLFLLLWPKVHRTSAKEVYQSVAAQADPEVDMIYIPSAGIQAPIAEGGADELDKGKAWHRFPDRGDPTKGGNFILTGHSFVWGYSPQQVTQKSIFYTLNDTKPGDEVIIRWDKQLYHYTVSEKTTVKPTEVSVEAPSKDPKMTIYTCTPSGSADGRVVLVAKPKS